MENIENEIFNNLGKMEIVEINGGCDVGQREKTPLEEFIDSILDLFRN